ncbi:MAG: hypothetical protein JNL08_11620 [Planctomycetes bacterium]|nr:hypothetical protein [Planctomycetota bacterium]
MPGPGHKTLRAAALLVLGCTVLWLGWRMAFFCDDAFITFRYVANAYEGHGLVWNPAPFRPVEGYTGFLWALLLWGTWSLLGVEPPAAAHVWSLGFGLVQFAVVAAALFALRRRDGTRWHDAVPLLALAVVATNRSFLQWLTSGLETALFHAAVVAWVVLGWRDRARGSRRWLFGLAATAAVAALTRPDGLLLVAATAAVAVVEALRRRLRVHELVGLAPLSCVVVHVGWRRWFYGEWLPNTYYAKVSTPWPEAGVRYLACFLFEHGTWLVAAIAVLWLAAELRAPRAFLARLWDRLPAVAVVAVVLAQVGYYTLVVGGDHFEYRVFAHLVPLGVLALVAMAGRLGLSVRAVVLWLATLWAASGVGWLQAWTIQDMTPFGFRAVADCVPAPVQPLFRWYDRQQVWLRVRLICVRCDEQAHFLAEVARGHEQPVRLATADDPFPVCALSSVGWLGWYLRDTIVVDELGLCDWVVARTPVAPVDPEPVRRFLAGLFDTADLDRSGGLDARELRDAVVTLSSGHPLGADMGAAVVAGAPPMPGGQLDRAGFVSLADTLIVTRKMAHERHAPFEYTAGLRPNVTVGPGAPVVTRRERPLTADEIRRHEDEWWRRTAAR